MSRKLVSLLGVFWGGAILIRFLLTGPQGSGSYAAGQLGGVIFGGLMFAAGLYSLLTRE